MPADLTMLEISAFEEEIRGAVLTACVFRVDLNARRFRFRQQLAVELRIGLHELLPRAVPPPDRMNDHARDAKHLADMHLTFQQGDAPFTLWPFVKTSVRGMGLDKIHADLFAGLADAFRPFPPVVRTKRRTFIGQAVQCGIDMLVAAFRQQPHGGGDVLPRHIILEGPCHCRDFHDAILLKTNNLEAPRGQPFRAEIRPLGDDRIADRQP